MNITKVWC